MGKETIIRYYNKKTDTTYVYLGTSAYDSDGKCTTKGLRKVIGKYNKQDEFQPNKTFLLMTAEQQMATGLVDEPYYPLQDKTVIKDDECEDKYYGYPAVIEAISKDCGMYAALKKVFPQDYTVILSCVQAIMCYPNRALYSPRRFHTTCWHSNLDMVGDDAITNALRSVSDTTRERFFIEFNKKRKKNSDDYVLALDTTSISTYSAMLEMAKYGYNKEGDKLKQINLLMVCESKTGVPIHYRSVAGNNADCVSVKASIDSMKAEKVPKGTVFSMDRGFCTTSNMELVLKNGYTFIMCMPDKCQYYDQAIDAVLTNLEDTSNYISSIGRYCKTYDVEVPVKKRGPGKNSETMTVYVYRDLEAQAASKQKLSEKFIEGLEKLKANPSLYKPNSLYKKRYIKNDDGTFSHNIEGQKKEMDRAGLFLVIGPKGWSPEKIHKIYKQRDVIEKDYENWKLRMRRPRHSIEEHLEGKVFMLFLVSVVESCIRNILKESCLDNQKTMEDYIDIIFNATWRKPSGKRFNEGSWIDLTLEQIKMLHLLKVPNMEKYRIDVDNLVKNEIAKRKGEKVKKGRKTTT